MKRVFVAGERGMVGRAVKGFVAADPRFFVISEAGLRLDMRRQAEVERFIKDHRPDTVIICAGKVGGILANSSEPASFLYDNLAMATHLIEACHANDVERVVYLGSSCIYPKFANQPIHESSLLTGELEPTNEPYAIAKIAGLKLCAAYRRQYGRLYHSVMPCNLYGPGDRYDEERSHVIPAVMLKLKKAKENGDSDVHLLGSGRALREFLYVEDLARAIMRLLDTESPPDWINVGSGKEISIATLAKKIAEVVGFQGDILFDSDILDGTPRKKVDSSKIRDLGWRPIWTLEAGLRAAYQDYLQRFSNDG